MTKVYLLKAAKSRFFMDRLQGSFSSYLYEEVHDIVSALSLLL